MLVQIKLRDPKGAYSDNGLAISGAEPIILELTPFVCGLIYRNEAEIFESPQDRINNKDPENLDSMNWIELKKLAQDSNINFGSKQPSKKQLVEALKGKMNELL